MRTGFQIPGTETTLHFERDEKGRLLRILCGGRCYLDATQPDRIVYDGGFAVAVSLNMPQALLRTVTTARGESWTENYRWNEAKLTTEIDGVNISYDGQGRVAGCRDGRDSWFYGYSGDQLTVIDTPRGLRQIVRDENGRPVSVRGGRDYRVHYDGEGRRLPLRGNPTNRHYDAGGRLWTISEAGRIRRTWLWADFQCFGRIDGPPGDPVSAIFSLDITGTPVRVIERSGMRRIPRDAYGESLLDVDGVPGLFCGIQEGDLFRLPYRRLDPRTGSFDSPDPFTGCGQDPRRAEGYDGPLLAEFPKAGPYTVCRHNPVTLTDPTGAISNTWWLIPSALTWSYQNTMLSIFGFWLTADVIWGMTAWLIANIFTLFWVDDLRESKLGKGFSVEGMSAKNFHAFAMRASGMVDAFGPQTFTYQFIVSEGSDEFEQLEQARLWLPEAAFSPTLNGTVLLCNPTDGDSFVLAGQITPPNGAVLTTWSRCGGKAVPAIPDSDVPIFPDGAMHFSAVQTDRKSPQAATMVELEPMSPLLGSVSNRARGTWPGGVRGTAAGQNVALIGTAIEIVDILSVATTGPNTTAQFSTPAAGVAGQTVRLRGLAAPLGPENLTAVGAQVLNAVGSALAYQLEDIVRLTLAPAAPVAAKIDRFEARVTLDEAPPAAFTGEFLVFTASATGSFNGTILGANQFRADSGAISGPQASILVGAIPCIVQSVTGNDVTVDRSLTSLGAANTPITWRLLTRGSQLGKAVSGTPSTALTYTADSLRSAPSTGTVLLEQGPLLAARTITAVNYDGIVVSATLSNPSGTFSVELLKPQAPDLPDVTVGGGVDFKVEGTLASNVRAFHIIQLTTPAIGTTGTALLTGATLTGQTLAATITAGAVRTVRAANVVVLSSGTTLEAGAIKAIRAQIVFATDVPGRDDNLEAVLLAEGSQYEAQRLGDFEIRVIPRIGGVRVDLPRFRVGELIRASDTAGSDERFYRITAVTANGSTITCEGDALMPAAMVPVVGRLNVADPQTGGSRLGIAGKRINPNTLEFTIWSTQDFDDRDIIAVVGDTPVARRVTFPASPAAATRNIFLDMAGPVAVSGAISVSSLNVSGATPPSNFTAQFEISGDTVTFTDNTLVPGGVNTANLLVVPYVERGTPAAGNLHAGNVRVPDDHENATIENDRRQAVIDHELVHTIQSARLGPWFFTWWPNWISEMLGDLPGSFGGPTYSETVTGTLETNKITIPSFGDVNFETGDTVQVSHAGRATNVTLGTKTDNTFHLSDSDVQLLARRGITGDLGIRKNNSAKWKDVFQVIQGILQFITPGGLMNFLSAFSYGGIIWLIMQLVNAIRKHRATTYAAIANNTTTLFLKEGVDREGLHLNTRIMVQGGDKTAIRVIDGLAGNMISVTPAVNMEGDVTISIFSSNSPFFGDLNSYLAATIPDPNRPARLHVPGLSTQLDDKIIIKDINNRTISTEVTAVISEDTFEVEEPVLDTTGQLFVARQAKDDPIGQADSFLLNKMQLGFLQYLHDPWGQIHYKTRPEHPALQVLTRSARYLFGTESWGLPALTGHLFWDNLYRQSRPATSTMEQEASHWSGDTYCPLATIHNAPTVVGDVGRYWLTCTGGLRNGTAEMINTGRLDAPGLHWQPFHTPSVTASNSPTSATPPLATAPAGTSVPDVFAVKDAAGVAWTAIANRAWIPANATLERTSGTYIAFTQPPPSPQVYAADAVDTGFTQIAQARQAAFQGPSGVISSFVVPVPPADYRVTIERKLTVQDVAVTIAGTPAAEAAVVQLIPFQSAKVDVTPNGARTYRSSVTRPGLAATIDADNRSLIAAKVAGRDFAEVSRFYDAIDDTTVSGIGGMHLGSDIDIAVRRIEVEVVTVLVVRGMADVTAAALTEIQPGGVVFLLVPAPRVATPAPTNASTLPVSPTVEPETNLANAATTAYIGSAGAAFKVTFKPEEPPDQDVTVNFAWKVGASAADSADVTASLTLKPHFTLSSATGFNVAQGASIVLEASGGVPIALEGTVAGVTPDPPGANLSQITLNVDAAAATGDRDILVQSTATPGQFARRRITITVP